MKRILLLSDTHAHMDKRIIYYSEQADEIWHAGDIGDLNLKKIFNKPIIAVCGNIDGEKIRSEFPADQSFFCQKLNIFMTHIGGTPGKYHPRVGEILQKNSPKLFICGHSHILKISFDKKYNLVFINPGAAGKYGPHKIRTMVRFSIKEEKIFDLEVIELGKN